MEDAVAIRQDSDTGFFGVFDGHHGSACAQFVANQLPKQIGLQGPRSVTPDGIVEACHQVDAAAVSQRGGSTAVFMLAVPPTKAHKEFKLHIGNVGDSRVLLGRGARLLRQTTDHKPTNWSEVLRILRCGGFIDQVGGIWRVDGILATSRAFGDREFKDLRHDWQDHKVTAIPSVMSTSAAAGDFVILACDGVFEGGLTNKEAVAIVAEHLKTSDGRSAASALVNEALRRGSSDNISAIVVQLKG